MKKLLALLVVAGLGASMVGCGGDAPKAPPSMQGVVDKVEKGATEVKNTAVEEGKAVIDEATKAATGAAEGAAKKVDEVKEEAKKTVEGAADGAKEEIKKAVDGAAKPEEKKE